ncbi:hypothetical protein AU191_24390 [Mycolicibacterium acapulense]|nr:hypothetical protein AU191_24390 [Mycolicibacterium acapulense]
MTAIYGMMAMMPLVFGGAGYFLVSSAGCGETPRPPAHRDQSVTVSYPSANRVAKGWRKSAQ